MSLGKDPVKIIEIPLTLLQNQRVFHYSLFLRPCGSKRFAIAYSLYVANQIIGLFFSIV